MPIPENKLCRRCNQTKHNEDFYKRRKGFDLSPYCKPCMNNQAIERQRKFKQKIVDMKGGCCSECGYKKYIGALEFHHLDPTKKDFLLSQFRFTSYQKNEQLILAELDKCILVCANCHREIHANLISPVGVAPTT